MNKSVFTQFFLEYLNGVWKGSMNRFIALLLAITIMICGLVPVIKGEDIKMIPLEFIGMLITLICGLLGLSAYAKNTDLKSTTPNPNLPASQSSAQSSV